MLAMSAEHLRVIRANRPEERLVWVDVGGGTGARRFLFEFLIYVLVLTRTSKRLER